MEGVALKPENLFSALSPFRIRTSAKCARNSFRIRTYEKIGEGGKLLTRHPTKDVRPERPSGVEGYLFSVNPMQMFYRFGSLRSA
jgi:hypothetical protein